MPFLLLMSEVLWSVVIEAGIDEKAMLFLDELMGCRGGLAAFAVMVLKSRI